MPIRVTHAAFDEEDGRIILRGRIDPVSFGELQTPDYQREVLPKTKISELKAAYKDPESSVPDLDLGMRGGNFAEDKKADPKRDGEVYVLQDQTFIIDGLQRTTSARELLAEGFGARVGAMIHFNTTEKWERDRFRILNTQRNRLSPNVLLRNMREDYRSMEALYNLTTHEASFVLNERVSWDEIQRRRHLVSAFTFIKTVAMLHSHAGPLMSNQLDELVPNLDKTMERVGRTTMRANVSTFFNAVDAAWGIRDVSVRELALYLRPTFLRTLARLMSEHGNFWNDQRLCVEPDYVDRLKLFKFNDPNVAALASGSGKSWQILYTMLVDHIDHGKRGRRLKKRVAAAA